MAITASAGLGEPKGSRHACLDAGSRLLLRWQEPVVNALMNAQGNRRAFLCGQPHKTAGARRREKRMRMLLRKIALLVLAGLTGLAVWTATVSQASEYPNKPVTLIVPFQAGISVDILLRVMAEVAGQHLGQPVVVDNKAGGSATLGPAYMASNAKPDGYTIAQIPMPVLRVPHLQKVTYDPLKDFTWIIQLGGYTIGVVVPAASEFKTFKNVIAFAKANPGKLSYT